MRDRGCPSLRLTAYSTKAGQPDIQGGNSIVGTATRITPGIFYRSIRSTRPASEALTVYLESIDAVLLSVLIVD